MPTIFKILVFLFLQQGGKVARDIGKPGGSCEAVNWETLLTQRPMTLSILSDELSVNEIINLCSLQDIGCEVKREMQADGIMKADVLFRNLKYTEKNAVMEKIRPFMSRIQFQWIEG